MTDEPSRAAARALIRDLVRTERPASPEEVSRIRDLMATAPFNPNIMPVPREEQGVAYLGVTLGSRIASLTYHLVKRVVLEGQWTVGTTQAEYLADLRSAVKAPSSHLGVYARRGGLVAATVTPSADAVPSHRLGLEAKPMLLVVYSADHDVIVTAYQFSSFSTISLPPEVLWLD